MNSDSKLSELPGFQQRRLAMCRLHWLGQDARKLETWVRAAMGAPPGSGMLARKADRTITAEAQKLRGDLALLALQTKLLRVPNETKQWLRALRQL